MTELSKIVFYVCCSSVLIVNILFPSDTFCKQKHFKTSFFNANQSTGCIKLNNTNLKLDYKDKSDSLQMNITLDDTIVS